MQMQRCLAYFGNTNTMTTEVKIYIRQKHVLPDVFDWINDQGWQHIVEWRWFRPSSDRQEANDWRYTFQFEKEEHATLFSLKWL
jgi:hypothetical protein